MSLTEIKRLKIKDLPFLQRGILKQIQNDSEMQLMISRIAYHGESKDVEEVRNAFRSMTNQEEIIKEEVEEDELLKELKERGIIKE